MKIMFWVEVLLSIFCLTCMVYDLIAGEYMWALFQAFWTFVDTTIAIFLGIEVWR